MEDTFLINRIYNSLNEICSENNIKRVKNITFVVGDGSDLSKENICDYFEQNKSELIGRWTNINMKIEDFDNNIAIIHSLEGEDK
ncbi:MAG: hypothetical protein N4A48_07040 [Tepidibacter sp.]|jgi:Zn finger protein HypA/HybF involved in hydrogenase expression|uniref:hypothetical protein n=1 Tax=Tepidibacter sp. TaxID=2529387 RepID=UPI0025CC0F13|nr:hypothetical protein [Tepidibacter sp.]MCT4508504.1 hypothetical protein [Tepidibacter sp.]